MRGPWAGELGQVQFLASRYVDYGVDFDGDGRVNMLASAADALASAAKYLQHLGWRPGEPWLTEVRVPKSLPWDQADVAIKLPVSQWAAWGVTLAGGKPLPDGPDASLLLPMGRNGPAFLAYPNFDVYLQWNSSLVYSTTAAYFATRLAGAPRVSAGAGAKPLSAAQVRQVQTLLVRTRLRRRQDRWGDRPQDARRGQGRATEARPAGRFVSGRRALGETGRIALTVAADLHLHIAAGGILDRLDLAAADLARGHPSVIQLLDPLLPVGPPRAGVFLRLFPPGVEGVALGGGARPILILVPIGRIDDCRRYDPNRPARR